MPIIVVDGPTIKAGEALSDGADCSAGIIVRLTVPQEYNAGSVPNHMTFQVSTDGNLYNDLVDDEGNPITIVARANSGIAIDRSWARAVAFIKLRSGTRQKQDCKFAIAISSD